MSDETPRLIPTSVRIGASLKVVHAYESSDGSELSVNYSVPEGITYEQFQRLVHEEDQRLAKHVLVAELFKGSLSVEQFKARKQKISEGYAKLFGSTPG